MKHKSFCLTLIAMLVALGCNVASADDRALATLANEPVTVSFPLDLGTNSQTATFTLPEYFVTSGFKWGSGFSFGGLDTKKLGETTFTAGSSGSAASEANEITFSFLPNYGLAFTPTKLSLRATRFGTDACTLDASWLNADGSKTPIFTGNKPARDNEEPAYSTYEAEISGAKAIDGPVGLVINVYNLGRGKKVGIADIVIEGTLSGTEKEIPVLGSFTANGITYNAEEVCYPAGADYAADIKLYARDPMISAANPVTAITAAKGTAGEPVYTEGNDACTVTVPLTLGDVTVNYKLNFLRKNLYTLTYYNTDGSEMGTQQIEEGDPIGTFAVDYTTAILPEPGMKLRGWYAKPVADRKYAVTDPVTSNLKLYAVATDIEHADDYSRYTFDLTNRYFYTEDHEVIDLNGGYWHDSAHGWAFKPGETVSLAVGPKANITLSLCRFGSETAKIVAKDAAGNVIATLPAISNELMEVEPVEGEEPAAPETVDGQLVTFACENAGTVTIGFEGDSEVYLHAVKVANVNGSNYTAIRDWYYVEPGNASSLLNAIEDACALNADPTSPRAFIYIPDGTYNLRQTVLTPIDGHNISLIGQSMKGTIIRNEPHASTEGIGTTAIFVNTGSNLYMQDLTLQNALDYYGAGDAGRAVCLRDRGTRTLCKNVTMLSYQDTYYPNNADGEYYWETSDIHGTVDFICGEGTMMMENSTLTVEKRKKDGTGECTLTASSTWEGKEFGYVFSNCHIVNYAQRYNFGRAWSNEPKVAYINTIVHDANLNTARWTAGGMNVAAKQFVEYNTRDLEGNVVSPASHVMTFTKGDVKNQMETILSDTEAARYNVLNVFPDWNPATLATQVEAKEVAMDGDKFTWAPAADAMAYAFFVNGELSGVVLPAIKTVPTNSYTLTGLDPEARVSVRALNSMGGMGPEFVVREAAGVADINVDRQVVSTVLYNVQGVPVAADYKGIAIRVDRMSDGSTVRTKVLNR